MTDEISFSLPKKFLNDFYKKFLITSPIGFLYFILIYGYSGALIAMSIGLGIIGLAYLFTNQYSGKFIHVSPHHIRGRSLYLAKRSIIRWSEDMTIEKFGILGSGVQGYQLRSSYTDNRIFLPDAIVSDPEFKTTIMHYAPKNHPLLKLCKRFNH